MSNKNNYIDTIYQNMNDKVCHVMWGESRVSQLKRKQNTVAFKIHI